MDSGWTYTALSQVTILLIMKQNEIFQILIYLKKQQSQIFENMLYKIDI